MQASSYGKYGARCSCTCVRIDWALCKHSSVICRYSLTFWIVVLPQLQNALDHPLIWSTMQLWALFNILHTIIHHIVHCSMGFKLKHTFLSTILVHCVGVLIIVILQQHNSCHCTGICSSQFISYRKTNIYFPVTVLAYFWLLWQLLWVLSHTTFINFTMKINTYMYIYSIRC